MAKTVDITGKTFGYLTVLSEDPKRIQGVKKAYPTWVCECVCGNIASYTGANLRRNKNISCGCKKAEHVWKNRDTPNKDHPVEYAIWSAMKGRCNNPNHQAYQNYGARNITYCKEWENFYTFLKDVGKRPSEKHSLDRIDNNGNYTPENVRWTTVEIQAQNRRKTVLSKEDVIKIREQYSNGVSNKELSERYNIGTSHVTQITKRKIWKNLEN